MPGLASQPIALYFWAVFHACSILAPVTILPVDKMYPYDVLCSLEKSGSIVLDKAKTNEVKKLLHRKYLPYLSLALGILFGLLYYLQHILSKPLWFSFHPLPLIVRVILVIIPTGYVTWSFVFRLVLNARLFRKSLKNVAVHPLHPDQAGGLRSLGRYALSTTYIIALAGSIAALAEYIAFTRGDTEYAYFFHGAILLYLLLTPAIFFAPLSGAHAAMRNAKEDLLVQISDQFNTDYRKVSSVLSGTAEELDENIEKVEQLQRLHKLTTTFPVWPYNFSTLRRFIITMSSPLITIILSIMIDALIQYLIR